MSTRPALANGHEARPANLKRKRKPAEQRGSSPVQAGSNGRKAGSNGASPAHKNGSSGVQGADLDGEGLPAASRAELEQLIDVLEAIRRGDLSARFRSSKHGALSRVGELLNDIIGMNQKTTSDITKPVDPGTLLATVHAWYQKSLAEERN